MKRRRFIQSLAAAPAIPLIAQQTAPPAAAPQVPAQAAPGGRFGTSDPPLQTIAADLAAPPTAPLFFNADQFAALRKLGGLFAPTLGGHPSALEAGAPEFLDFLLSVSPADRQRLYRDGLDQLNAQAKKQFHIPFAELDATQADAILRPMLSVIPWVEDLPKDPVRHFIAQAQRDFRTATQNSREWASAGAASGRRGRGFGGGVGLYWLPIDPVKG
jgi:Gluconate 2-dehydrogenase subunit 3